jgi:preprotein translocase subunit SecA
MIFPVSVTMDELAEEAGGVSALSAAYLERELVSDAKVAYEAVEERIGADVMRQVERQVLLQVLDAKWREHLYEMDYLKEGIGLRAMGQRDPLIEYQREAYQMFEAMTDSIKEQSLQVIYRVEKRVSQPAGAGLSADSAAATATKGAAQQAQATPRRVVSGAATSTGGGGGMTSSMGALTYSGPSEGGEVKVTKAGAKGGAAGAAAAPKPSDDGGTFPGTAKNAQCPCGSGKKYKMCHGKNEA